MLLVEDDDLVLSSLTRALRADGYEVVTATSIGESSRHRDIDLMICDLSLPDGDGLELVRQWAVDDPLLPIIILTARRDDADIVAGLIEGAVDYVVKPFQLAELLARIHAQLRVRPPRTDSSRIRVGGITISLGAREVTVGEVSVELRRKEFDLLVRLAASAGTVVSREQLIKDVWRENWWGSTKTLDVHINSLRRKLGEEPGRPSRIVAVRGVGYRLNQR